MNEAPEAPKSPDQPEPNSPSPVEPSASPPAPNPSKESPPSSSEAKNKAPLWQQIIAWPFKVKRDVEIKWSKITQDYEQVRRGQLVRTMFFVKIILLHTRYIFGYLAAGFLVSAPLYIGTRFFRDFNWEGEAFWHIFYSLVSGLVCLIPFLILIPVTRIDWENMKVPEFKNFELALTRWASYLSFAYLVFCFYASAIFEKTGKAWWFDLQIAWINFTLMLSAWARIKIQTLIFKDFYELSNHEGLILRHQDQPQSSDLESEPQTPAPPAAPEIQTQEPALPEGSDPRPEDKREDCAP